MEEGAVVAGSDRRHSISEAAAVVIWPAQTAPTASSGNRLNACFCGWFQIKQQNIYFFVAVSFKSVLAGLNYGSLIPSENVSLNNPSIYLELLLSTNLYSCKHLGTTYTPICDVTASLPLIGQ